MPSEDGKIILMGSGEMTATMVEVHKNLLDHLPGSPQAAFLDTPAGFQLNVDQISQKAAEYFRVHVQHPLAISSFKSLEHTTDFDAEQAFHVLRQSAYILIGPGSPTYAVHQWRESPVPEIFTQCVANGGCLVAASAAALTVGRFTLPVYEIYKVGQNLHWVDGIDILGNFGINLIVIPHWNNAEGGTHDTRFCFMGEPRFRKLEALLPENVPILGLDEHTACILNFKTEEAQVKGIGKVTLRIGDRDVNFETGERFSLDVLRGVAIDQDWKTSASETSSLGAMNDNKEDSFWSKIHTIEVRFHNGLEKHDPRESANALLELDRMIWQAQANFENEEFISQSRDTLRDLIALLGTELTSTPRNKTECLAPLVDALLKLRQDLRANKKWAEADTIRNILEQVNIKVEDARNGSRWQLVS